MVRENYTMTKLNVNSQIFEWYMQ